MRVRSKQTFAVLAVALGSLGQVARAADEQGSGDRRKQLAARAADEQDPGKLREEIEDLRASVAALKQSLLAQSGAAQASGSAAGAGSTGGSQPAEPEPPAAVTHDDLNGLRSDLETFKYQYSREREYNTALANRPVNVSGTLQTRVGYVNALSPAAAASSNNAKGTFSNGAASLQFSGNLYRDYEAGRNLTYLLRAAAATTGGVNLQFASLTYNLFRTLSPEDNRLTVTIGQQIQPFGLDVAAVDELKPTIKSAQFTSLFPNAIDIGILLKGELGVQYDYGYSYRAPVLAFYAGVLNGAGANKTDDNAAKDLFARLVFTVPADYNSWLRQLAIGVSGYNGRQNTTVTDAAGKTTVTGLGLKRRLGFDVYYNHHPFGVTYEYVRGWDGRTLGATPAAARREEVKSDSHVVTLYYTFGEQFLYGQSALGTVSISRGRFDDWWPKSYQPFVRFDSFDPARGQHDVAHGWNRETYTAGFNVFFAATTKFQLNFNLTKDHSPVTPIPNVREIVGQFQFGF